MKELIIAPSVLSLDYSKPSEQMDELKNSKAKWLHFDVMDSHFVSNLTFGPDILKGLKKRTDLKMDVHIMVSNVKLVADLFLNAGIEVLTFHYEAIAKEKIIEMANYIKQHGVKAGISIKPQTDVSVILPYLQYFDLVLVMSVEPGFGGQPFLENAPTKIKILRDYINQNNLKTLIEVDGGINLETAKLCVDAGVNILVAGSYIFKGDINTNIDNLWKLQ